jgi:hypothetical protein
MSDTNHPDYFPELRFHTFESYAHKWAESGYWPFMKRIVLYRIPVAAYDFKKKYLLFFELSESTDRGDKDFAQSLERSDWLISLGESPNKFREIYKKEPGENYLDEWIVKTKLSEGTVEKCSWMLFSRTDKEKTNNQDLKTITENKSSPGIASAIEATDHLIKDKKNVFKRAGKNWLIKYEGESATFPDYERIRYIVHLLNKPWVQISVIDLFEAVKKENISDKIEGKSDAIKSARVEREEWRNLPEEKLHERGLSLTDLSIDGLTEENKDKFEDLGYGFLQKLKDAKKNKNQPMIDRAEKELENYKKHLLNEYGIKAYVSSKGINFIQKKRPGPETEKARKNVLNQINSAIADIKKEIPSLAQYLRKNINTGTECTYRPDDSNPIDWHIIW